VPLLHAPYYIIHTHTPQPRARPSAPRARLYHVFAAKLKREPARKRALGTRPETYVYIILIIQNAVCLRNNHGTERYSKRAERKSYRFRARKVCVNHALTKIAARDVADRKNGLSLSSRVRALKRPRHRVRTNLMAQFRMLNGFRENLALEVQIENLFEQKEV
jgi:hypothetical protein